MRVLSCRPDGKFDQMPQGIGAGALARERLAQELAKFQDKELVVQASRMTDVRTDTLVAFKDDPDVQCGLASVVDMI